MSFASQPLRVQATRPPTISAWRRNLRRCWRASATRSANAANTAALLFDALPELNWVGFYFLKDGELVVGPFQGKPACVRIALGQGVCGTAAASGARSWCRTCTVSGHIACDAASRSEIVVPLLRGATLLGVLDLDSPQPGALRCGRCCGA